MVNESPSATTSVLSFQWSRSNYFMPRILNQEDFSELNAAPVDPRLRQVLQWIDHNVGYDTITQIDAAGLVRVSASMLCPSGITLR